MRDNLLRCGVIHNDSRLCVAGCGSDESSSHLFLHCHLFGSVWHHISRWLGISTVSPLNVGIILINSFLLVEFLRLVTPQYFNIIIIICLCLSFFDKASVCLVNYFCVLIFYRFFICVPSCINSLI
jgi:hypothetical protein